MKKLIAIDDGHGMTTSGKRTPFFPNTKKFMHENEFNRVVAQYLKENLERCGFDTIMVAPTDEDVPLKQRTDTANGACAGFFISIHANALNGIWGNQQGVSTHCYPGSVEGNKAAKIILNYLIQGTQQKNRGVVESNFHVLRETNMPSVLAECAFMDNLREANLLMTDDFRHECADEIAKGICEYFGVKYVERVKEMTFEQAVEVIANSINTSKEYWTKRKDIDVFFPLLMIKIAEYVQKVRGGDSGNN